MAELKFVQVTIIIFLTYVNPLNVQLVSIWVMLQSVFSLAMTSVKFLLHDPVDKIVKSQ